MNLARAIAWMAIAGWVVCAIFAMAPKAPAGSVREIAFVACIGVGAIATLLTWATAWIGAILSGRLAWGLLSLFAWPAAFYYVLAVRPRTPAPA